MTGLKEWKPLLCSPSPRNIPEVLEAHRRLPYDKLYAKYFIEGDAYWHLRNFFLKSKEYTHMILIPDDLVVLPQDMEQLWYDLQEYDYPILSGMCNVDLDTMRDYFSITENLPHPVRPLKKVDDPERRRWWGWRWYAWFNSEMIKKEQIRQAAMTGYRHPIFRVMHSGFALQCLRRDVVEKISFVTDAADNAMPQAECSSVDIMFSNSCALANIAIMVDPRIKMLHLRHGGPVEIELGDSEIWHVIGDEKRIYKTTTSAPKNIHRMLSQWDT